MNISLHMNLYIGSHVVSDQCTNSCKLFVVIVNGLNIYDYKHLNMQHMGIKRLLEQFSTVFP